MVKYKYLELKIIFIFSKLKTNSLSTFFEFDPNYRQPAAKSAFATCGVLAQPSQQFEHSFERIQTLSFI